MRGDNGWTKVLGNKAKLARRRYSIVTIRILIAKINLKKAEEMIEKITTQNARMYTGIKIESIFWLFALKIDDALCRK